MAGMYQQQQEVQGYPLAPATVVPRSDKEYASNYLSEERMKRKKRMKCFAYIAAFAVFQTVIILVFALVVMRVKTPKVRLGDVEVARNDGGDVRLAAKVRVKNTNFGRYKFDDSMATVWSGNNNLGQFLINDSRVRARSTKKISVIVDLNSSSSTNSSTLDLRVESSLRGKVELMRVIKKKKTAEMDCAMIVDLSTNAVQDLRCK